MPDHETLTAEEIARGVVRDFFHGQIVDEDILIRAIATALSQVMAQNTALWKEIEDRIEELSQSRSPYDGCAMAELRALRDRHGRTG